MEKELIKLLLNKKFYNKNKSKLSKEFFTNGTGELYETIQNAHDDSDNDFQAEDFGLQVDDLLEDEDMDTDDKGRKQGVKALNEFLEKSGEKNKLDDFLIKWYEETHRSRQNDLKNEFLIPGWICNV